MACSKKDAIFCLLFLALYAVFRYVKGLDQCDSDSDCSNLQYCCERISPEENVCGSVCIGESCVFHSHCAPGESCCASDNVTNMCHKLLWKLVYLSYQLWY